MNYSHRLGSSNISGVGVSNIGMLYFNYAEKTVTRIYETGYSWELGHKLASGDWLIAGDRASGVLLYDTTNQTLTSIYEANPGWTDFYDLPDGDCLIIGSNYGTSAGVLLYSASSKTITQIYEQGLYWKNFFELPNGNILITSNKSWSTTGVLLFDISSKTISRKINYGTKYSILSNGELISSEIDVLSVNVANYSLGSYMGGTVNGDYIFAETKVQKISDGSVCNLNDTYSASYLSKYNIAVGSKFIVYKN